tara:strand:+ start:745 stop:1269 length:525 start_codon:yes stop_codon:yes gene_type:complete
MSPRWPSDNPWINKEDEIAKRPYACEQCLAIDPDTVQYKDGDFDDHLGMYKSYDIYLSWCCREHVVRLTDAFIDDAYHKCPIRIKNFGHCDDKHNAMAGVKIVIPMMYARLLAWDVGNDISLRYTEVSPHSVFIERVSRLLNYDSHHETRWQVKLKENPKWKQGVVTLNIQWRL